MPLIILSGLPSSGKTYRARQIVEDFERRTRGNTVIPPSSTPSSTTDAPSTQSPDDTLPPPVLSSASRLRVHLISDHTLRLSRNVYSSARTEKDARAALYSAVKRALGRDDIVVLDSGNYIKGWRYQLHCEAKAMGTPSCVVHVGTSKETACAVNMKRLATEGVAVGGEGEEDAYDKAVFEELIMRFEEPNGMARWDSPLFTVLWEDESPPCEGIWEAVVENRGKDGRARVVRPNQSTMLAPSAPPTHLYDLDRTTQLILSHIQTHLTNHPDDPGSQISIPLSSILSPSTTTTTNSTPPATNSPAETLTLILPPSPPTLPHLQRLRRQYIAMHRQQSGGLGVMVGGDSGGAAAGGRGAGGGGGARKMSEKERLARGFVVWLGDAFGG